jgi:hypothetical protein
MTSFQYSKALAKEGGRAKKKKMDINYMRYILADKSACGG